MGESSKVRRHYRMCQEGGCKLSASGQEAEVKHPNLVRDVRTCVTYISIHFSHDANMFITVQKGVFVIAYHAIAASMGSFVGFKTGV